MIGNLVLTGTDTANLSVEIPSDSYPSRWVFFDPIKNGESDMAAYHEPVYSSRINVTIKNAGTEPLTFEYLGNEQTVVAGGTAKLPEMDFKNLRLQVGSKDGHKANIELGLKFDKAYRTSSWKLVAEWSNGP